MQHHTDEQASSATTIASKAPGLEVPANMEVARKDKDLYSTQAVNEALRELQQRLLNDQLQHRVDRELAEGEALVSKEDLSYWNQLSDA